MRLRSCEIVEDLVLVQRRAATGPRWPLLFSLGTTARHNPATYIWSILQTTCELPSTKREEAELRFPQLSGRFL